MGKYESVYRDLVTRIEGGVYPIDTLLPSEHQLTDMYGVSRETARRALALLTSRGYIQKIVGKGSIILGRPRYALPVSSLVSYRELTAKTGPSAYSRLLTLEKTDLPTMLFKDLNPQIQPVETTLVERLRFLDYVPSIIDRDYVLTSVVPDIPSAAAEGSLYEYFEQQLGLTIGYSSKLIKLEPATAADRKRLNLANGEYVAITVSVTSLADTTIFQYTESRHRADKFIYRDFARRKIRPGKA